MLIEDSSYPHLKDNFFYTNTISATFWNSMKDYEQWDQNCVPLYMWNNVLYVGCVKPIKSLKNKNIVLVLISAQNLNMVWKIIKNFSDIPVEKPSPAPIKTSSKKGNILLDSSFLHTIVNTQIFTKLTSNFKQDNYQKFFNYAKKYFSGMVIFNFDQGFFKPIEWNDEMAAPAMPINTTNPSAFKVIVNSKNTYHGELNSNNKIHTEFFTQRGFSAEKLPAYLTIIPIFDNAQNIIGAVLGTSDTYITQNKLNAIVSWTQKLSPVLQEKEQIKQEAA